MIALRREPAGHEVPIVIDEAGLAMERLRGGVGTIDFEVHRADAQHAA